MFGFRSKNRRRRTTGQKMRSLGERISGLGRRVLPIIFLLAVAIGVPAGIFQAYLKTVSGSYFQLSDIEVSGLTHLQEKPLLDNAKLIAGRNIFDIDLKRVERRLKAEPWVKDVQITRRLPDHISVAVEEYVPVAVLVGAQYELVSEDGVVFAALKPEQELGAFLDLPLISGLDIRPTKSGRARKIVDPQIFFEALEVATLYQELGLQQWEPLSEVYVDSTLGLTLVSADSGVEVRLGRGQYRERLKRLESVQRAIAQRDLQVDYILIDQESDLSQVTVGRRDGPVELPE